MKKTPLFHHSQKGGLDIGLAFNGVFTNHKKSHTTKFHTQMHMLVTLSLENEVFFNNSF